MDEAGMLMRWRWRGGKPDDVRDRPYAFGVTHPLVSKLLALRGVQTQDQAKAFLEPKLTGMHDPAALPGCVRAAERLERAVHEGQPIIIYGDYDVDGITASAILWHVLTLAGAKVSTYVPHRIEEGYGLNCEALQQFADAANGGGKPLVVSVDCGITAIEPAAAARRAGLDLIITDHHEFDPAALPDACALVHPRLHEALQAHAASDFAHRTSNIEHPYPFPSLCGAGVAFKLAWQFARIHCGSDRLPDVFRDLLLDMLSLAALGTVADVVPLIDENRIITRYGLGQIKRTRIEGLNALIDAARLRDKKIDSYHVGFVLGPRLNACGRMGHAKDALQLLTTARGDEAKRIAGFLGQENDRRRQIEREICAAAIELAESCGYHGEDCRAIVLAKEGWHAGVLGIVASRLVERFHRPVVMMNIDNGEAHGSCRSVDGVSILDALQASADHLTSFGGHAMAAGLRLPSAKVDAFREALVAHVNERLTPAQLAPVITLDAECCIGDVDLPLWDGIQSLAPFGRSNPSPMLCLRAARTDEPARRIGQGGKHLRLLLRDTAASGRRVIQCVGFGMGDLADGLPAGVEVDVAFQPAVNTWQGVRRPEVHIKDLRLARRG